MRQTQARELEVVLPAHQEPESGQLRWMFEEFGLRLGTNFPVRQLGTTPEVQAIEDSFLLAPAVSRDSVLASGDTLTLDPAQAATESGDPSFGTCQRCRGADPGRQRPELERRTAAEPPGEAQRS